MSTKLYVNGAPNIPAYVTKIVKQVKWTGLYTYVLRGIDKQRPAYGIHADFAKLKAWAERHGAEIVWKKTVQQPKKYYIEFEMTDPVAQALERAGMLK